MAGWTNRCGGVGYDPCCYLFTDPFDRDDSATVGNGWDEGITPAAWFINGNRLQATLPGAGAVVYCIHSIAAGPPNHAVEVDIKATAIGLTAGVLARYNLNLACYLSLELEWDANDCATLTLWNNKTCETSAFLLAQAAVATATLQEWHHLKLCYREFGEQNEAQVYGELETASGERVKLAATTTLPTADPADYNNVGVIASVGDDESVYFDNFTVDAQEDQDYECCNYCYYGKPYDCLLVSDNFDRNDANNLGCLWGDCANGDIESNQAVFTASNTLCQIDYLSTIPAWAISFTTLGEDDLDELRGIIAIEDSDNFLFAQLTVDDTCGSLKLFQRAGGVNTQLGTTVAIETAYSDQTHTMRVCWNGTHLWAHVTTQTGEETWYRQAAQIDAAGLSSLGGIGVGSITTKARFNNFRLEYMHGVFEQFKAVDDCELCRPDPLACIIHEDGFDRPDNIDPGCYWEEVTGDHDIVSNLLETITAGIIISRRPNGYGDSEAYITVSITAPSNGNSAKVICDYTDASNYHYLSISWGVASGTTDGRFQLYRRSGAVDTALLTDPKVIPGLNAGDTANVTLCFYGTFIEATVNNVNDGAGTTSVGGDRAGLGGGNVSVKFNDWSFEYLLGTAGTENCGDCIIFVYCDACVDGIATDQLRLRIDLGEFIDGLFDPCPLTPDMFPRTWILEWTDAGCTWCGQFFLPLVGCGAIDDGGVIMTIEAQLDTSQMLIIVTLRDCSAEPILCGTGCDGPADCVGSSATYRRTFVPAGDDFGTPPLTGPHTGGLCQEWSSLPIAKVSETHFGVGFVFCTAVFPDFVYISAT